LELERQFIERTDFSATRRGYDPDEVERHLREIAEAVDELKRSRPEREGPASLAGAAAEQVRSIVEAAERSAADIEANARQEAERVTGEANRQAVQERTSAEADARSTRERADSEAATHVQKVSEATAGMLDRADNLESELGRIVDELRGTITGLVDNVRAGAGSLSTQLEEIRAGIADVREAGVVAAKAAPPGPMDAEPEVVEEVQEAAAEADAEPEEGEETVEAEVIEAEEEPAEEYEEARPEAVEEPAAGGVGGGEGAEGARLIALNMALNGTPRDETARYLRENFDLENSDAILDEVYARVGG